MYYLAGLLMLLIFLPSKGPCPSLLSTAVGEGDWHGMFSVEFAVNTLYVLLRTWNGDVPVVLVPSSFRYTNGDVICWRVGYVSRNFLVRGRLLRWGCRETIPVIFRGWVASVLIKVWMGEVVGM